MATKTEMMAAFKELCLREFSVRKNWKLDPNQEQDWYALSLGFFKAMGASNPDAHDLAVRARYRHKYWEFT